MNLEVESLVGKNWFVVAKGSGDKPGASFTLTVTELYLEKGIKLGQTYRIKAATGTLFGNYRADNGANRRGEQVRFTEVAMATAEDAEYLGLRAEAEQAGDQFYSQLAARANAAIGSVYNTTVTPIQFPSQGDFKWFYENDNQVFNEGTWNYLSARVSQGDVEGTARLTDAGGFPNAYVRVVNAIAYTLSKADQAKKNEIQLNAEIQAKALVGDYQGAYGEITAGDIDEAKEVAPFTRTKLDYIFNYVLGYLWSGRKTKQEAPLTYMEMSKARDLRALLPYMPPGGDSVLADAVSYLQAIQPILSMLSSEQLGSYIRRELQTNTENPDENNGGIQLVNPSTGGISDRYQVAYSINSDISTLKNDLDNEGRKFSISMDVSKASGNELNVSIDGTAGFSIGSWLKFTTQAGASYDMSRAEGTSMECSVSMEFEGYTMVPISAEPFQTTTRQGWYFGDPIAEAHHNADKDVTGFKFVVD
ncbi:MAG: hypothetical protein MI861_02905, partial [Pirellulales bacterium]|nr:hypothetical protein [Pirellulales bacterium]